MRLRVQVVVENDDGEEQIVRDAFELKPGLLGPDTVGLGLAEAKELLAAVQEMVVDEQVKVALAEQEHCRDCGTRHATRTPARSCCAPCSASFAFAAPACTAAAARRRPTAPSACWPQCSPSG